LNQKNTAPSPLTTALSNNEFRHRPFLGCSVTQALQFFSREGLYFGRERLWELTEKPSLLQDADDPCSIRRWALAACSPHVQGLTDNLCQRQLLTGNLLLKFMNQVIG
jgi:hypothetical protein